MIVIHTIPRLKSFQQFGCYLIILHERRINRERPGYWQKLLTDKIELMASVARKNRRPLVTTECWGLVDYKDWPLLKWDWIKDLCELGAITAARTGMWVGVATSNFCGPQFEVWYGERG